MASKQNRMNRDIGSQDDIASTQPTGKKKGAVQGEFEKHEGWHQNCRSEKRQMIESIKRSIAEGDAMDKSRAEKLCKLQEDQLSESAFGHSQHQFLPPLKHKPLMVPMKGNEEMSKEVEMRLGRNQLYMQPFDVFDIHHPVRGKKRFNKNFRPLRSKIDLKVNIQEAAIKEKEKIAVKQSLIDEFDRAYAENCNQELARLRARNVSQDNPFDARNKPPAEHVLPEKITIACNKPHDIKKGFHERKLAGSMTGLGTQILDSGPQMARHIVTYPWKETQYVDQEKPTQFNNEYLIRKQQNQYKVEDKPTNKYIHDYEAHVGAAERHTRLHEPKPQPELYEVRVPHRKNPQTTRNSSTVVKRNTQPDLASIRNQIKNEIARSPKGIRINESRIEYLEKAKAMRSNRVSERKTRTRDPLFTQSINEDYGVFDRTNFNSSISSRM